jgi:hypothetical protein
MLRLMPEVVGTLFRPTRLLPQQIGALANDLVQKVAEKADITMPELAAELAAATCEKADPASFTLAHPGRLSLQKRMARPVRKGPCRDWRLIQSASTYPASRSFLRP